MAGENSVAILGAGISGLTLAKYLDASSARVEVFEKSSRCGGWIESEQRDGFLLEHGPNTVLSSPDTYSMIQDLGLENSLLTPLETAKTRFLYSQKLGDQRPQMRAAPRSLWEAVVTPLLSKESKKEILKKVFNPPKISQNVSVHDFFSAHLGEEFAEDILAAAIGGIYAADIKKLSFQSAFPRIAEISTNARSLFLSFLLAKLKQSGSQGRRTLVSFENGLETLPKRIVGSLIKTQIHLNSTALEICPKKGSDGNLCYTLVVQDSSQHSPREHGPFRHIFVTLPSAASSRLLQGLSHSLASKIAAVPHASVGVTHLCISKSYSPNPLEGFGMLIPPRLSRGLLGVVFSSSVFSGRAPEDHHLLTCFSGGALFPEKARVDDSSVLSEILLEVSQVLSLQAEPRVLSAQFLPNSIPNYALGHQELESEIDDFSEQFPNLHLVSSWRSGIGVPERIRQAKTLAEYVIVEDLHS